MEIARKKIWRSHLSNSRKAIDTWKRQLYEGVSGSSFVLSKKV